MSAMNFVAASRKEDMICTDCKSDKFVWDWANGDVVCTGCGLVVQERIMDEKVGFKDRDDYYPLDEMPVSKRVMTQTNVLNATLFNGMLESAKDMAQTIDAFCQKSPEATHKADVVTGMYTNTKGISAKDLCLAMKLKPKQLWKGAVKHDVINNNRSLDLLKRTIYECDDVPVGREWEVLKIARKFLEALDTTPAIQNIKPDRLVVSLMIVACEVLKLGLKRTKVCHKYKLSKDTLCRHETMLQEALRGI
jgi:hypothetical protein